MKDKVIFSILGTLLFLIMLIGFVDSASPFTQTSATTLKIEVPAPIIIPLNGDYRFHAHVINETRAKTNLTTSCFLHVYNTTGYDIAQSDGMMEFESYNGIDFAKTIGKGNFSTVGTWNFVIQCNSSSEVGFYAESFQVTPTGFDYSQPFLIGLLIGMILIALCLFYVSTLFKEDQVWIKLFFIVLGLGCLVLTTSLGVLGSNGSPIESVFKTAQIIMITITSLIMAYLFIIMFKQTINNLKNAKRNRIQAKYGNPTN